MFIVGTVTGQYLIIFEYTHTHTYMFYYIFIRRKRNVVRTRNISFRFVPISTNWQIGFDSVRQSTCFHTNANGLNLNLYQFVVPVCGRFSRIRCVLWHGRRYVCISNANVDEKWVFSIDRLKIAKAMCVETVVV